LREEKRKTEGPNMKIKEKSAKTEGKRTDAADELALRLEAGYRLVGVETADDAAAEKAIDAAARRCGWGQIVFRRTERGDNPFGGGDGAGPLVDCLSTWENEGHKAILVLQDAGGELEHPAVEAWIKEILRENGGTEGETCLLAVGRHVAFGPELGGLSCVVRVPLPGREEIGKMLAAFEKSGGVRVAKDAREAVLHALQGLPGCAIPPLLRLAHARHGKLDARGVLAEKTAALRRDGLLEPVELPEEACEAGGMRELRGYLAHVARIFAHPEEARAFGVDVPKGVLIAGMPGCGKSLAAKAAAKQFGLPLLRLDTGRLMGKYNGDSERNLREALALAEAQAPCVLWIDEIEKAFAGVGKDADNGVATRLFGSFLTWMNERSSPVYAIATANDILGLPPELMRRGRFDELFFVDFPNAEEAAEILRQQLRRRGHALAEKEIAALARDAAARGFSGADLEGVVKTGIELAFERWFAARASGGNAKKARKEVLADDFREAFAMAKSTRESMGRKIEELRARLGEFRLIPASAG